ncbi:MAG: cyclic nucleotide-binding domain-containing protein [Bacteriovoracaceae bacterium]
MKKNSYVLLVEDREKDAEIMSLELSELGRKVILAKNGQEARLKHSNQDFSLIVMNMDIKGLNPLEFALQIRNKEKLKNIKERVPMLINGSHPELFQEQFSQIDNVQFLSRPYTSDEFKEKVASFKKKTSFNPENTRAIKKGEFLIMEGGKNHEMFWVLSGGFEITKINQENRHIVIGQVNQGELVGEMSFLDNLPRSASVKAREDSEVLVIPHKKFMDVLDGQPRWFRSLMTTLSYRLRDADQRIAKISSDEDS